ncbi:MAG: hypothetical protein AAB612_00705 [Patescibacteria group bacterium]
MVYNIDGVRRYQVVTQKGPEIVYTRGPNNRVLTPFEVATYIRNLTNAATLEGVASKPIQPDTQMG